VQALGNKFEGIDIAAISILKFELEWFAMKKFNEINVEDISGNAFKLIGKEWMLVAAEKDGKTNAMTASWGGLGVMWNKNVAYVALRPQRYTKEFIDSSDTFSLSFYDESYREKLSYLGSVSGRQEDKIAKVGFTKVSCDNTPYFDEARLVLICKKLYSQKYDPDGFIDKTLDEKNYPDKDYHTMYIVEITKALLKE
jgi:flavin reductase (DIM6/NTAB) family NADH-FMN oxidoreductase RutF